MRDSDAEWEDLGGGVSRKILAYESRLMMARVAFEEGAVGEPHSHPHTQCAYVESGTFDVTIDGKTERLDAGDSFVVASGLTHGVVAITAGELIDVFTPMRDDFLG